MPSQDVTSADRPSVRSARSRRPFAIVLSVGWHAAILLAILASRPDQLVQPPGPEPMTVQLVAPMPPPPPPPVEAPPTPEPTPDPGGAPATAPEPVPDPPKPKPPPKIKPPKAPPPKDIKPIPVKANDTPTRAPAIVLSEAQIAGATTAGTGSGSGSGAGSGSGSGGGACNMPRRLQNALRKDPRIRAAVAQADASGRPVMVWNGDWVRHGVQEGSGLAAVREAIMWEVAFAPEACRTEPVRGLVLLSLNDGPGAGRVVVGSDRWRWTDLLHARGARVTRQ